MDQSQDVSKGGFANGLLRWAVVSGFVSGLAATSLSVTPTASATCIGISGINIGSGCNSSFGNFALVLGDGTATATGFLTAAIGTGNGINAISDGFGTLAYAGGSGTLSETQGNLSLAIAGIGFEGALGVGTNVSATAGLRGDDFVNIAVNVGSAADAPDSSGAAKSTVVAGNGTFNLAGNLFGNANSVDAIPTPLTVRAGGTPTQLGFGAVAANVFGNRNDVEAIGTVVNATNWGNAFKTPNGSDSTVTAGTSAAPATLSWAFNVQGIFSQECTVSLCGNTVSASGPGSIAGAIAVIQRNVSQDGPGIDIATQINDIGSSTPVVAASATQRNLSRPSLNFTPGRSSTSTLRSTSPGGPIVKFNNQLAASAKKFNDQLAASAKTFNNQLAASAKKSSHNVNATRGAAKPDAAGSTDGGSDK